MFESMRKIPFFIALIVIFLGVLVELGSNFALHLFQAGAPNGKAISAMAFLDGLVFYIALINGLQAGFPGLIRVQAKIQGIVQVIFTLLLTLGCIGVLIADFVLLMLMVSLLMAVPFGTIAYFAIWGTFDTDHARVVLSLLMTLKIAFAICLVLAHQGFLKFKPLVMITLTSFVCNLLIAFLHAFVPGFLVSITDDIGAIIICILAIIWAIPSLIGGIGSMVKVVT